MSLELVNSMIKIPSHNTLSAITEEDYNDHLVKADLGVKYLIKQTNTVYNIKPIDIISSVCDINTCTSWEDFNNLFFTKKKEI